MSKHPVKILLPAYQDLDRIAEYHLYSVGPISAENITDNILDKIALLQDHPLLAPEHQDPELKEQGYRKLVCADYICIYRIIDKTVYIYRIVHSSTDYPTLFK